MDPTINPTTNPTSLPEEQEAVNVDSGKEEESSIGNEGAEPDATSEFEDGLTEGSVSQTSIVESNESISGSQTVSLRGLKAVVSGIFLLGVMQII